MKEKKALMIVHQKRSSTGDVGYKLKQRGYQLDVKRPVFGETLPDNMDNHDLAVIYGGPPSANDDLDYIKYETEWISTVLKFNKPFLGICLGFQLLFNKSVEIEDTFGLGIVSGEVKDFSLLNDKIRVPHVGWNNVKKRKMTNIVNNINPLKKFNEEEYFYFVHSYYVEPEDNNDIYTTTEYGGINFCSSILKENIFACQFHPEKSGEKGIRILSEIFNK